jgi:hypothetical protein
MSFDAASDLLKRDDCRSSNRHRALAYCLRMIFSENRYALFRIMRDQSVGGLHPFAPLIRLDADNQFVGAMSVRFEHGGLAFVDV